MLLDRLDYTYDFQNQLFNKFGYFFSYPLKKDSITKTLEIINRDYEVFKDLLDSSLLEGNYVKQDSGEISSFGLDFGTRYFSKPNFLGYNSNPNSSFVLSVSLKESQLSPAEFNIFHNDPNNERRLFEFYTFIMGRESIELSKEAKEQKKVVEFLRTQRIKDPKRLLVNKN